MKISYCGIGQISFVAADETYVGEVAFQTTGDDRLTGMHKMVSHDLNLTIRIRGDAAWPFERVQEAIRAEASNVLGLAREHIVDATMQSLAKYNEAADREADAEREEEIAAALRNNPYPLGEPGR